MIGNFTSTPFNNNRFHSIMKTKAKYIAFYKQLIELPVLICTLFIAHIKQSFFEKLTIDGTTPVLHC